MPRARPVLGPGNRARLDCGKAENAFLAGGGAPEALEGHIGARLAAGVAAGAVGLPDLDHRIAHRVAAAVEQPPGEADRLADRVGRDEIVANDAAEVVVARR